MKKFLYVILGVLFLSSCRSNLYVLPSLPPETSVADSIRLVDTEITSSKAGSGYRGISRVRTYKFSHPDVPAAFDGFRIAFISDLHYKSLFKEKGLENLVRLLNDQRADVLLVGGDLHEGCEYVAPVVSALAAVKVPMGTYVVLGNNDYEACYADIVRQLEAHNIHLLEHRVDTLKRDGAEILIHVGLDTVNLKGKHFHVKMKSGDTVKVGDCILEFDLEAIKAEGYDVITPVIISNHFNYSSVDAAAEGHVKTGEPLLRLH